MSIFCSPVSLCEGSRNKESRNKETRITESRNKESQNIESRNMESRNKESRNKETRNHGTTDHGTKHRGTRNHRTRNHRTRSHGTREPCNNESRSRESRKKEAWRGIWPQGATLAEKLGGFGTDIHLHQHNNYDAIKLDVLGAAEFTFVDCSADIAICRAMHGHRQCVLFTNDFTSGAAILQRTTTLCFLRLQSKHVENL